MITNLKELIKDIEQCKQTFRNKNFINDIDFSVFPLKEFKGAAERLTLAQKAGHFGSIKMNNMYAYFTSKANDRKLIEFLSTIDKFIVKLAPAEDDKNGIDIYINEFKVDTKYINKSQEYIEAYKLPSPAYQADFIWYFIKEQNASENRKRVHIFSKKDLIDCLPLYKDKIKKSIYNNELCYVPLKTLAAQCKLTDETMIELETLINKNLKNLKLD